MTDDNVPLASPDERAKHLAQYDLEDSIESGWTSSGRSVSLKDMLEARCIRCGEQIRNCLPLDGECIQCRLG